MIFLRKYHAEFYSKYILQQDVQPYYRQCSYNVQAFPPGFMYM